jgi:hypothetical protein
MICLCIGDDMEDIYECIKNLQDVGMLGLHIRYENDGMINMTQVGLTDRTIKALYDIKQTLAPKFSFLEKDEWGDPLQGTYIDASSECYSTTRDTHDLNIMFAMSQCA